MKPFKSEEIQLCPKCGKVLVENAKWPGHFMCPDYREPVNDRPPFQYKCTGQYITDKAAEDFWDLCRRMTAKLN